MQRFMRQQLHEFEQAVKTQREEAAQKVEIRHYLCDHLGTPNALIREDSRLDWAVQLDAWGNVRAEHNPGELYQPIRLPGQHADGSNLLHYNRHRYFDPTTGSYISDDPIGLKGGISKKSYANLNPLKFNDALGLNWQTDPLRRTPESLGSGVNTIFCDGETPKVYVQELNHEQCQLIKTCTIEHEAVHLEDALKENADVCKGNSGSVIIVTDNKVDRLKSEERAFAKEIECLERESKSTSIPACKSRSNSKKAGVEWQLKYKVLKGDYP
ncbi:hypothetical protein GCM10027276_02850 [Comamonas piscis]